MRGIHFVPQLDGSVHPILWRCPFPEEIQRRLITFDNPNGDINSIKLELAASVARYDILAQEFDVREDIIHNSSNNFATVWWQQKGATSSSGPTFSFVSSVSKLYTNTTVIMCLCSIISQEKQLP
jgi:hypothetical protein